MDETPDKGPICFLDKHLTKFDYETNLIELVTNFPNTHRWINNHDIDAQLSNELWTNNLVTDS